MLKQLFDIRRILRQTVVLAGLAALLLASGMDWAEAATRQPGHAVPGALHVLLLFFATIAFVVVAVARSQKPVRVKARRRTPR